MHFPLNVPLGPSRAVMASILAVHATAGLALFHVPGLFPLRFGEALSAQSWLPSRMLGVVLWVALLGSLLHALWKERAKQGLVLVLRGDGGLGVGCDGGGAIRAIRDYRLDSAAVDFGWAIWLPLVDPVSEAGLLRERVRGRLMLLRTNMAPAHWRQLRIWLRHKAAPFRVG